MMENNNDIPEAQGVEIILDITGKLWVNVDGRCVLRIGHCKMVTMDDPYRGFDLVWGDDKFQEFADESGEP